MKLSADNSSSRANAGALPALQRRCACGNHTPAGAACNACGKKQRSSLQTKLTVNEPGDVHEQEADRTADQILAMSPQSSIERAPPRIQRLAGQTAGPAEAAPASVDRVLSSPGRALEPALRHDMEQRFGHDFSGVRTHTGPAAEESAREVSALAYTVGKDIVFGSGQFSPQSQGGRRLLAHELTHVVQQSGGDRVRTGQGEGRSGPGPNHGSPARLQRRLSVNPNHPTAAAATDPAAALSSAQRFSMMDSLLQALCDRFEVDGATGEVLSKSRQSLDPADLVGGSKATGCCCLNVLTSAPTDWIIEVSQVIGARTIFGTHEVFLNPPNAPIEFGSFTSAGTLAFQGAVPTAGHELCGHAALNEIGAHPAHQDRETTDVHDPTVRIENLISTEQGVPASELRGLAASGPHRGESTDRITIRDYPLNGINVPASETAKLDFAASYIDTNSSFVSIVGHSDSVGSTSAKQSVSQLRANAVKQALRSAGVTDTVGVGGRTRFAHVQGVADREPPPAPLAVNQANWRRVDILTASLPAGALTPPPGTPTAVTPHVQNPGLAAAKTSVDPCSKHLASGAYP